MTGRRWACALVVLAACGGDGGGGPTLIDGAVHDAGSDAALADAAPALVEITIDGNGVGTVTSSPPGIDCPGQCSAAFPGGSEVVLTATSDASWWEGWGDGICSNPAACAVHAPAQVSVTFTRPVLTIVNESVNGSGVVTSTDGLIDCGSSCEAAYPVGALVSLTPTPASDSIIEWVPGPCGSLPCDVVMNASQSVRYAFYWPLLMAVKAGSGAGTITSPDLDINCGSDCYARYPKGSQVTLTAVPDDPFSTFVGWIGDCVGTGTCTVTMAGNDNNGVEAEFLGHRVVVAKQGMGGGVVTTSDLAINCGSDCSESYLPGSTVTLTAVADDPYSTFVGWSGACSGTGACTVTVDGVVDVTASFSFDNGDTSFTATQQGTPAWSITGFEAWSITSDYNTQWALLWNQHVYNATWNAYQPGTVHAPPYATEVADRLPSQGWDSGNVFRVAHWTSGRLLSFAGVIVPNASAPTGTTADYASGPYIPKDVQLSVDADVLLGATVVDPDFDGPYPRLVDLMPGTTVDGWSHMTLTFGEGAPWVPGVAGNYTFHLHVYETANPGNGWIVDLPFTVVN
jgi:hypothetical protein